MKNLKGTFTALVTPFKNNQIDYVSLKKLVQHQVENGVNGFVINGTTAESPTLKSTEVAELFKFVREIVGAEFPLVMGTGSNSTEQTITASRQAEELGAAAVLVVVPYYNKPPQRGLIAHFKAVAEAIKIPVILYNVPGRTITALEENSVLDLQGHKNIVAIKEASGKIDFDKSLIQKTSKEFVFLSGDDGTYVEFLGVGGHGVISVASHIIPKQMVQWKKWADEGQLDKAREDISKYSKLIDLLFVEANPIPVKKALQLMGILESASLRLPLVEMDETLVPALQEEMKKVGLL